MSPLLLAVMQGVLPPAPPLLTVVEIVDHMVQAEHERMAAFSGYTAMRRYHFENEKAKKRAEMSVRVSCDRTGAKTFEMMEESGSGFVRSQSLRRMIEAERQAGAKEPSMTQ